jgi:hypothetical protein
VNKMMTKISRLSSTAVAVLSLCALAACGKGKNSIPGVENFNVGVLNQQLIASFVSTTINLDAGAQIPIYGLQGAFISATPYLPTDGSPLEGTLFQVSVDLNDLQGTNFAVAGLPDGRPIPDIEGGELPRWSFPIKGETIYLYLADQAFGIFIPLPLSAKGVSLGATISATVTDERGNTVGKVYAIPSVPNGSTSGLLVLLPLPGTSGSSLNPS